LKARNLFAIFSCFRDGFFSANPGWLKSKMIRSLPIKKPFKQKMLEGLHPVFLTLGLLLPIPMPADKQQHAKAGLLASPSF